MPKPRLITFGIPRSGTTYIWRVANEIVPGQAAKTHEYSESCEDIPILITIRDFRDCLASLWRVHATMDVHKYHQVSLPDEPAPQVPVSKTDNNWEASLLAMYRYLPHLDNALKHSDMCSVVYYEDWMKNPDIVYQELERLLDIDIQGWARETIQKKCDLQNVEKIQSRMSSFNTYDGETLIHGQHSDGGTIGRWKTELSAEQLEDVYMKFGQHIKRYGYWNAEDH